MVQTLGLDSVRNATECQCPIALKLCVPPEVFWLYNENKLRKTWRSLSIVAEV